MYLHKIWFREKNRRPGNRNNFKFHFYENPTWRLSAMLNILKWPYLCYRPDGAVNAMFESSMGLSETTELMVKLCFKNRQTSSKINDLG